MLGVRHPLVLLASLLMASFSTHHLLLERANPLLRCPLQRAVLTLPAAVIPRPTFASGGLPGNQQEPLEERSKLTPAQQCNQRGACARSNSIDWKWKRTCTISSILRFFNYRFSTDLAQPAARVPRRTLPAAADPKISRTPPEEHS